MDPDPNKKYTKAIQAANASAHSSQADKQSAAQPTSHSVDDPSCLWPKGPYTQQIQGILPAMLTDDIILSHLQASGKQFRPKRSTSSLPANIDYSTLQRGHQYFMEGYIPGKHVMFCVKDEILWIKAQCYHSQKKHAAMHNIRVAITTQYPCHVTRAFCTCVAGKAGMCSHVVGLLKQILHYVMMKCKSVPEDLCCTQMQQAWHKPRSTHIEAEPVMNVMFCKAKQQCTSSKKSPAVCSLYEARASAVQEYCHVQQLRLKEGLIKYKPTSAFASILPDSSAEKMVTTFFGAAPKGSILSYQSLEYDTEKKDGRTQPAMPLLPPLPTGILDDVPCVYEISNDRQKLVLDKLMVSLEEARALEQSTQQQSSSDKWLTARIGRVTASRFGDVLLRRSPPTESFIKSFFEVKDYATLPAQLSHGCHNEGKARNIYNAQTGFTTHICGLVVNPSLPWLGASPDALVIDPSEASVGLLEIKCPYTHRLCTVEEATGDPHFCAEMCDGRVTLKHNHKHFYQVQGQMALAKVQWCDFMIYTFKNHTVERISFDCEFWDTAQAKLTEFYFNFILPKAGDCVDSTDDV